MSDYYVKFAFFNGYYLNDFLFKFLPPELVIYIADGFWAGSLMPLSQLTDMQESIDSNLKNSPDGYLN